MTIWKPGWGTGDEDSVQGTVGRAQIRAAGTEVERKSGFESYFCKLLSGYRR